MHKCVCLANLLHNIGMEHISTTLTIMFYLSYHLKTIIEYL